jgi:hypothetical protein
MPVRLHTHLYYQTNKIGKVYSFEYTVLHAISQAGCFVDNHGSKELWTYITLTQKNIKGNSGIQSHYCENVILGHGWNELLQ